MSRRVAIIVVIVLVIAALGVASGLRILRPDARPQAVAASPPPPQVGVVETKPAEIPYPVEYAGRVESFREVEVRPQVGGILLTRAFDEGTKVSQGQLLFQIDPATYQVAVNRAQAQLEQAQATLRDAEANFQRTEELFRRGVSSEQQRSQNTAARDQAQAAVQLAQAEVKAAQLNLGYTRIEAPVAGVSALTSPPVGTLVQAQQTLLTTITPLDPAYVSFSFSDEENRAFRELNQRRAHPISGKDLTIELRFGNGQVYPQPGTVDIAARRVDPQTGTIQARAVFPNPDGALLPGQFVRIVIHGVTLPDAIVIPAQAVSQGPQGPSVFVVGSNDVAQARPIRLGPELAQGWVVQDGLKTGERVVVDGVIRVRPGAPVQPQPAQVQQTSNAPAPAGGQALDVRR